MSAFLAKMLAFYIAFVKELKLATDSQNIYYIDMRIVEVIPLSRGVQKETLSYFTGEDVPVGALVSVPLRGRTVAALVLRSEPAENMRQDVKAATFEFKKINSILTKDLLSPAFLRAAQKTADFHVATLGALLFSVTPKVLLENAEALHIPSAESEEQKELAAPPPPLNGTILQTDDNERFSHYRSIIRQEFARNQSVILCVPTLSDIKKAERLTETGIGEYAYFFHSGMTKKKFVAEWNKLALEKHPVLIVTTGHFLCLPRHDIGTVILERENSKAYKVIGRPYTDMRVLVENFSKEIKARLVFGDTLLRTETFWRYKNDELGEITPPTLRIPTDITQTLVDTRRMPDSKAKFEPLSPELLNLVRNAREKSEPLVIFSSRRGLSPLTICADCSTIVSCKRCRAPVTLHSSEAERYFMCHRCGDKRDAHEKCTNCLSWRLQTLGIGSELIAEEVSRLFPDHSIFRLDADTVKTHTQAKAVAKKFYEAPGGVLIGTEMALPYLDQPVSNVAVASIDSMFALPDFRARERILSTLLRLKFLSQKKFLIQTRNVSEPVFGYSEKGNLLDFYKQEFDERQNFDFPPFTILIKISLAGERGAVEQAMEKLRADLSDYSATLYPAFNPYQGGQYTMHLLIKIGRSRWVEKSLAEKLKSLPPVFRVQVDPESVL